MVKNRKKYVIIIIAAALIILAFAPRLFTEIRTQHFLKQNNGVDFGGLLSDYGDNFAVLKCGENNARMYCYRIDDEIKIGCFVNIEKNDGAWDIVSWDKSWSASGDGSIRLTPSYWWHIFYAY